ncbi:tRNA uridine 5-carboxymethylaminomethyl modification protein [bacterium SM23_31]|nr:MAG: tRNA uridine 5-carboxymethylaminomethyl modification protein [bacterium SM23_31]
MLKNDRYDIVVVGAGHAGCEAALVCARCGMKVLLVTMDKTTAAKMYCNPAIGGLAKGHLVREIDALGGQMAKTTDATGIQFRMLNRSKGPAVWSPRAQADKKLYSQYMIKILESQPNLTYAGGEVTGVVTKNNGITEVVLKSGETIKTRAVIIMSGTFLGCKGFRGKQTFDVGGLGEPPAVGLTQSLVSYGIRYGRLKTGTPPRLDGRTIDWTKFERQYGDPEPQPFSFSTERITMPQISCYLGWTNEKTHEILHEGFSESPLFTGRIKGVGPRYCPSIEVKIEQFADKTRHQIFLEPEGLDTHWIYINGFSTSLPVDIQVRGLRSIPGLENVEVLEYGYAVEYDYFPPDQLKPSLETKAINRLFLAGQINGTSGYEEAAAQGIIAGLNAIRRLKDEEPFILQRSEAYIGVLIDDLITKPIEEPYRLFTSRAEYRLLLRQDNANERLMHYGRDFGLITEELYDKMRRKKTSRDKLLEYLKGKRVQPFLANPILETVPSTPLRNVETLYKLLKRPEISLLHIFEIDPELDSGNNFYHSEAFIAQVEMEVKYAGYIDRLNRQSEHVARMENTLLPETISYKNLKFLSMEARDKLQKLRPRTLGQASRIAGISVSDITNLMIHLRKHFTGISKCST